MKLALVKPVILFAILLIPACNRQIETPVSLPVTIPDTKTAPAPSESPAPATATPENAALQAGQWTYIFYDDGLEQILLVNGGPERGKPAGDPLELWAWEGSRWSLVSADPEGPTWRNWAAVAYDPAREVLVVHGGLHSQAHFDETWEWDGQTWTRFTGEGPGAREGAVMAYDAARGEMILFGGSTPDMEIHADTWSWDGQSWTKLSETGPAARFPGGMVYDPAREEVLLYSGHFADPGGSFTNFDDLWAWDGSDWREIDAGERTPGHRTHSGLVFDPVTERVFLISGGSDTFRGDVWAWDGAAWEQIPATNTPARSGSNVAYDPTRDRFVLFGGVDRPGGTALDDTWEWDRAQWTCVSNC